MWQNFHWILNSEKKVEVGVTNLLHIAQKLEALDMEYIFETIVKKVSISKKCSLNASQGKTTPFYNLPAVVI